MKKYIALQPLENVAVGQEVEMEESVADRMVAQGVLKNVDVQEAKVEPQTKVKPADVEDTEKKTEETASSEESKPESGESSEENNEEAKKEDTSSLAPLDPKPEGEVNA